jgi:hypothetical protein
MREILDFLIGVYASSLSHIVSMGTCDEMEGVLVNSDDRLPSAEPAKET